MKKALILLITISVLIMLSAVTFQKDKKSADNLPKISNKEHYSSVMSETQGTEAYIIREYNERIGIFRIGAGIPFRIIDTFVFTLPHQDAVLLSHGFTVYENELAGIVEDYTG